MSVYKRNDPELQEEEESTPAPAGKRIAPEVHAVTRRASSEKGKAHRKRKPRSWESFDGVSAYSILKRES